MVNDLVGTVQRAVVVDVFDVSAMVSASEKMMSLLSVMVTHQMHYRRVFTKLAKLKLQLDRVIQVTNERNNILRDIMNKVGELSTVEIAERLEEQAANEARTDLMAMDPPDEEVPTLDLGASVALQPFTPMRARSARIATLNKRKRDAKDN